MNKAVQSFRSAPAPAASGYDETEARLVASAAALKALPLERFAVDLMHASIHETGHQLMAIWAGGTTVKSHLSLIWPHQQDGRMVAGSTTFDGIRERMSSRRAVGVAGIVAESLMPDPDASPSGDEWDLFERLRDGSGMPEADLELAGGKITWHAVKRASKLLRRHWSIVRMLSQAKRKTLLYQLTDQLSWSRPPMPGHDEGMSRRAQM